MKERPILMQGEMVRATLDGRKTQTRRVTNFGRHKDGNPVYLQQRSKSNFEPYGVFLFGCDCDVCRVTNTHEFCIKSPYGQPGDRLWVREGFWHGHVYAEEYYPGVYQMGEFIESPHGTVRAEPFMFEEQKPGGAIYSFEGDSISDYLRYVADCQKRDDLPSIKYEWEKRPSIHMPRWASRINLDVVSVKVERVQDIGVEDCIAEGLTSRLREHDACCDLKDKFRALWDKINGKRGYGWDVNPFVWRVEFKMASDCTRN